MNEEKPKKYKITKISELNELSEEMKELANATKIFNKERIKATITTAAGLVTIIGASPFSEYKVVFTIFGTIIVTATFASVATSIEKMHKLYSNIAHRLQEKNGAFEVNSRMEEMGQEAYLDTLIDDVYEEEEENDLGGKTL